MIAWVQARVSGDSVSNLRTPVQGYEPPHRNKQGTATWETPTTNTALGDTWTSILSAHGACTCDLDLSWVSGVSVGIMLR